MAHLLAEAFYLVPGYELFGGTLKIT